MESTLQPEMAQSLAAAVDAMRTNRPADAEAICLKWLSTNPGCANHLRLLSHALMKQRRLDEAEEKIRFALSLDPEFPQLEEDLGSVLALKGRYDEAIPHFERAIRQEPALPMPYKKLGQALIAVGRGNEADDYFRMFLDRDPGKKAVAEAIMQVQEGRTEEAVRMLRGALKANPDNVDAMRYLAAAYLKDKTHMGDAEALLRRASQLAPGYAEVLMLLGSVLMERNKFTDAAEAFDQLVKLQPNNDAAWAGLGQAYARDDRTEDAERALGRAVDLNPRVPLVLMSQAHILKTLGKQEEALRAYREAIRLKPNFGEVYWSMANLKVFRFKDAEIDAMEEQLESSELGDSAEVHFRFALAKAWEDRCDYDKAWHYYDSGNRKQRMLVKPSQWRSAEHKRHAVLVAACDPTM